MLDDSFPKPVKDYIVTPEVEEAISQKAEELYKKRVAPYAPDLPPAMRQAIIDSQKIIYLVDYYGEHTQNVDPTVLDSFWKKCDKFLGDLGVPKDLQVKLLQDVKDYANIEASTRTGAKLADYEISYFYFKKSCDVRSQRHLIRFLTKQPIVFSDIEVNMDIIEEIEDDLDDLEEDKKTPLNGNRLLEILNSKNIPKLEEYITLIESLKDVPEELVQKIKLAINKLKSELK